ncbi:MAG TPA: small basic family protein [Thermoanaerobacterales bacterium]|jgi:small basic protein|nr:small basic family protein [Thermoanaerobacterales bacterium]
MIYSLIGLLLGLLVGFYSPITVPTVYAPYVSISILAALDSVFGGIRAIEEDCFEINIFITGFFSNALMAGILAYFGDRLGIQLYLAAIFAFGVRIFQNLAIIRRSIIARLFFKNNQK